MKRRTILILIMAVLIAILLPTYSTIAQSVAHSSEPYSQYASSVLTITADGFPDPVIMNIRQLEAMEESIYTGRYTMRTLVEPHVGTYTGIRFSSLMEKAGIPDDAKSVVIRAADGISMTFAVDALIFENYINESGDSGLPVILAFAKDGIPLVPDRNAEGYIIARDNGGGPLRLIVGQTFNGERNSPKWIQNVTAIHFSSKAQTISFTDLGAFYSWAEEAIYGLAEQGIISGVGNGRFAPEQNVTRAQFTKMILGALGIPQVQETSEIFTDVDSAGWAAPYIEAAVTAGLMQGTGTGAFEPDANISRYQIACLMTRALGAEDEAGLPGDSDSNYRDKEKMPAWAARYVAFCEDKGLFDNIAVGYFNGNTPIKRAEAAVIIYRMQQLQP